MRTKKIMLAILGLLVLGQILSAQDIEKSVFFESGKQTLTEEAKITLNNLVSELKILNDFELDITAFTDDVGTITFNQNLASERASTVKNFLHGMGVNASEVRIKGLGELALVGDENIDLQRSQNRRVDIKVTPFNPTCVEDLYRYNSKRSRQEFRIYTNRDTTIVGKKGSSIYIPANSIVTEDGSTPSSDIALFTLVEAYSNQDIILNNLSTVSNNNFIETGGMVYLEAKTEDGKNLVVREGAELQLNLVSNEQLESDMQLFYSEKQEDAVPKNINWVVGNQPFTSINYMEDLPKFNVTSLNFKTISSIKKPDIPQWPQEVVQLPEPLKPAYPKLKPVSYDLTELKAMNPRKKQESQKKYIKRIEVLVAKSEAEVKFNQKVNERLVKNHNSALLKYDLDCEKYKKSVLAYKAYIDSVDTAMDFISNGFHDFNASYNQLEWSEDFNEDIKKLTSLVSNFNSFKNYILTESGKFGFHEQALKVKNLNPEQKAIKKLLSTLQRCSNVNKAYCKRIQLEDVRQKINGFYKNGVKNESEAKSVYSWINSPYKDVTQLNAMIENYNLVLEKSGFLAEAGKINSLMDSLSCVKNEIDKLRKEKGILTKSEVKNNFINSTGINKLGWINCDRFSGYGRNELISVYLKMEDKKDADIFVLFEDIRSVMKFNRYQDNFVIANVPKSANVKIVVLNLVDGKFEVAIKTCKIQDLKYNTQFDFNKCNLSDIKKIIG